MNIYKNLKSSFYNIFKKITGGTLIYNAATGALIFLDEDHYKNLECYLKEKKPLIDNHFEEELIRNGILVPYSCDENKKVLGIFEQAKKSFGWFQLTILPVEFCNFRCIYCYESFRGGKTSPTVAKAIIRLVMKKISEFKGMQVAWFGGEPLLNTGKIYELSKTFQSICSRYKRQYNSNITTNGFLLNYQTFINLLDAGITTFQVTLDGLSSDHNLRRPLTNGGGTFERIYENLINIKKCDRIFNMVIRLNFDENNICRIPDFMNLYKLNFGMDKRFSLYFRAIYPSGTARDKQIKFCSVFEGMTTIQKLWRIAVQKEIGTYKMALPYPRQFYCEACLSNSIIVGTDGKVWKCTMEMNEEDAVGILNDNGEIEFNDKVHKWEGYSYKNDFRCLQCQLLPLCHGGCLRARSIKGQGICIYTIAGIKKFMYSRYLESMKGGEKNAGY